MVTRLKLFAKILPLYISHGPAMIKKALVRANDA